MSRIFSKTTTILCLISSSALFSAPAMALRNVTEGQELKAQTLTGMAGETIEVKASGPKVTLVVFWASWSPRSLKALADFQELYAKNGGNGKLEVIAINVEQPSPTKAQVEMAKTLAKKAGVKYKLAMDENLTVYKQLGVVAVPSAVLTDKTGKVLEVLDGYPPEQSAEFKNKAIQALKVN